MDRRLTRVSIFSGLLWGLIPMQAFLLRIGVNLSIRNLLVYGLAGTVIGLMTGSVLNRVGRKRMKPLVLTAGLTLLVTTILMALLVGITTELLTVGEVHSPPSTPFDRIVQAPIWWVYGLVASGFVLLLWPLAVLNHLWFFKIRER